eukprot:1617955-Pleurochrysis_carterae.AAC.1
MRAHAPRACERDFHPRASSCHPTHRTRACGVHDAPAPHLHRARARNLCARLPFAVEPTRVTPFLRPARSACACIGRAARGPYLPSSAQCVPHAATLYGRARLVAVSVRRPRATSPPPVKLVAPWSPLRLRRQPQPVRVRARAPQPPSPWVLY